jgi:hypothetical protein
MSILQRKDGFKDVLQSVSFSRNELFLLSVERNTGIIMMQGNLFCITRMVGSLEQWFSTHVTPWPGKFFFL